MAVAVRISPKQMTKDDYARVMSTLESDGHGSPEGRQSHTSYGDDHLEMFEVWESPEHYESHHPRLVNAVLDAGLEPGMVIKTDPVHQRFD